MYADLHKKQGEADFGSNEGLMPKTSASPCFLQRLASLNQCLIDSIHCAIYTWIDWGGKSQAI